MFKVGDKVMKNNIIDHISAFHHIKRAYEASKSKWVTHTIFLYVSVITIFMIGSFIPVKFGMTKTSAFIIALLGTTIVVIIGSYINLWFLIQVLERELFMTLFKINKCWEIESASKEENQDEYLSFIKLKLVPVIIYAKSKLGVHIWQ